MLSHYLQIYAFLVLQNLLLFVLDFPIHSLYVGIYKKKEEILPTRFVFFLLKNCQKEFFPRNIDENLRITIILKKKKNLIC